MNSKRNSILLPGGGKGVVSKENLAVALKEFWRTKRVENLKYDVDNLSEEQVVKLLTDNYKLDFLGDMNPSRKFRMAR